MKRKHWLLFVLMLTVLGASLAVAQESLRGTTFQVETQLGFPLPNRLIYDPVFDRYAEIDVYGALHLVDGKTFVRQHTLYREGGYNDFAFSNDGRWLALAIEQRIELWDAQTGVLAASLTDLSEARRIYGPVQFSDDDQLLLFYGTYPAPQELRRFENDTTEVPWLWHLPSAREEGSSPFPRQVEALPFFDYRNGFVMGPNSRIVAALPGRLHVLDAMTTEVLYEIDTARFEQDPLTVLRSARDQRIYVRPVQANTFIQVDADRGVLVEFPLNTGLTLDDLNALGSIELGQQAGVIGEPSMKTPNPLLERMLGEGYNDQYLDEEQQPAPITVTLIDFLMPVTGVNAQLTPLLFVYNEQTSIGSFRTNGWDWRYSGNQVAISPEGTRLLLRTFGADELLEVFDLDTGERVVNTIPIIRGDGAGGTQQRVLAYSADGSTIISDYERLDAGTLVSLSSNLRYSTRFERFYFTDDNAHVVTLSGSEWRLWDIATGEVERRQVLSFNGQIFAQREDGSTFLTRQEFGESGVMIEILDALTGERQQLRVESIVGRSAPQIIPSPDWQYFLIIYASNPYGPYSPGNEVAMWGMEEQRQIAFIAGDDLPSPLGRSYGWVDDRTAYIYGEQQTQVRAQPERFYGAVFAPSGVPECLLQQYPDRAESWVALWDQALVFLRNDSMASLAVQLCSALPGAEQVEQILLDIATPRPLPTLTPVMLSGVPICLTERFPFTAEQVGADWRALVAGLGDAERAEMERLLCEGLEDVGQAGLSNQSLPFTMLIDAITGERQTGSFTPQVNPRPIQPILDEFRRTEGRSLEQVILSPDEQRIAASGLPGELVIYRLVTTYRTLLDRGTATAAANLATANLIGAMPSSTPTPGVIGTARPTLTPTMTVTPPPRSQIAAAQERAGETQHLCPSETLYSVDNLPPDYVATGRILGPVQGEVLWAIEPENGRRNPAPEVPACTLGLDCRVSPDRQNILIWGINEIYVVKPDGSESRVLFEAENSQERQSWPREIYWSGANTLEWQVYEPLADNPNRFEWQFRRDILGVFPDPPLYFPQLTLRAREATIVSRQPGGDWVVAYTTFSTGINEGYQYYLYNVMTGEQDYFARLSYYPSMNLSLAWHPLGDRLYYGYPELGGMEWYQYVVATGEHQRLLTQREGTWSNDGRYRLYATDNRAQPIGWWDSQTGLQRTYCLPETGARLYEGPFVWSPDNRYVALQTLLPEDEMVEGVGRHVLVLDTETGSVTDLTFGGGDLFLWINDPVATAGE
jgi:hypothetical protein